MIPKLSGGCPLGGWGGHPYRFPRRTYRSYRLGRFVSRRYHRFRPFTLASASTTGDVREYIRPVPVNTFSVGNRPAYRGGVNISDGRSSSTGSSPILMGYFTYLPCQYGFFLLGGCLSSVRRYLSPSHLLPMGPSLPPSLPSEEKSCITGGTLR